MEAQPSKKVQAEFQEVQEDEDLKHRERHTFQDRLGLRSRLGLYLHQTVGLASL
jgi:hypothetical protein